LIRAVTERIRANELEDLVQSLAVCGAESADRTDGLSRIAFSDDETQALNLLEALGRQAGLECRFDAIGNLYIRLQGATDEVVQLGSHIDSVPEGGLYDGTLGIVAGFASLRAMRQAGLRLQRSVEVCCWRGEEHTFDAVYKGSATAFGASESPILGQRYRGQTLEEAILAQGLDPSPIREGQATLTEQEREQITAHLELHIEQAISLEREGLDIGIVDSISGHRRLLVTVTGAFDHSGATAMGPEFRRDANLAMAYMQVRIDELARRALAGGKDFVQTVGVINNHSQLNERYPQVGQNAVTKVSGFAYFTFDLMGTDNTWLDEHLARVKQCFGEVAEQFRVEVAIEDLDRSTAVALDDELQTLATEVASRLGYTHKRMSSGAGHDCALIATQHKPSGAPYRVGLIFVPCRGGISHSPREYCSPEQMLAGARVLCGTALRLAEPLDDPTGAEEPHS
jgi:N-carbamoyl-L-amino-acid hydrolase